LKTGFGRRVQNPFFVQIDPKRETAVIRFKVNGQMVESSAPPTEPLLQILANDLGLNGHKYGCGKAQCGACTVLVNGDPQRSCVFPLSSVSGRSVVTLQGLSEGGVPSRLQQAFVQEQAAQCGYCTSGMIMQAQALLNRSPRPTESEVRIALDGNLCRCGAHNRIVRAVMRAAQGA
jgi:nicotinate dehydrogenase subunit A